MSNSLASLEPEEQRQPKVGKNQRFIGLDLFRGIAAFAVVILHSDEVMTTQPTGWPVILKLSAFAVPFFLAASFYLTIGKLNTYQKSPQWGQRLFRLLIPYGFWSLIYLNLNIFRSIVKQQPDELHQLFHDPLGLIFLGQAGFHLYFIPLLVIGTLIVIVVEPLLYKQFRISTLLGLVISSLIIYQSYRIFIASLLLDQNVPNAATGLEDISLALNFGSPLLSVFLKLLGYGVRCLPYITIALLLSHPSIRNQLFQLNIKHTVLFLSFFVLLNCFTPPLLIQAVHESLLGYSAVLLALAISNHIKGNRLISSVGNCSFGIYLMHLIHVEMCWSILKHLNLVSEPIFIFFPLLVTVLSFTASWITTALLIRRKFISRIMFGIA